MLEMACVGLVIALIVLLNRRAPKDEEPDWFDVSSW